MKGSFLRVVALGGWAGMALAGCAESKAKPAGPPPPPAVQVAPVVRQDVTLYNEAVGSLEG